MTENHHPESNHVVSNDYVHPRVTAKKTLFDIHRHQRSQHMSDVEAPSDISHHTTLEPRIQWSAGTTDVGSHFQKKNSDKYSVNESMKPILRQEPSRLSGSSSITLIASKRPLPPVPDTWAPIDAQPTQPEEIEHLIAWSPILERADFSKNDITKPGKKFLDKLRKASSDAIIIKIPPADSQSSREPTPPEDIAKSVKPVEEFRRLNEKYVRDGIISMELLPKDDPETTVASASCNKNASKRPNRYHDLNNETRGKHAPLPARRSCEPLDIKNLRKLHEPDDCQPGASGVVPKNRHKIDNYTSEMDTNTNFATRTPKISIVDTNKNDSTVNHIRRLLSEESFNGKRHLADNIDVFKIDNPFSDFSLQTINARDKIFLKSQKPERGIKEIRVNVDPAQPGTSSSSNRETSSIDAYSWKVSHSPVIAQHEEMTTLKSSDNEMTPMRETSFLDKAVMTERSQLMLDAVIRKKLEPINLEYEPKDPNGTNSQLSGMSFLSLVIRQVVGERFNCWSSVSLKNEDEQVDFVKGSVFDCHYSDMINVLIPLMENVVKPTFSYILRNNFCNVSPSLAAGTTFAADIHVVSTRNDTWTDAISFFGDSCPTLISHMTNIYQIHKKPISQSSGMYEFFNVSQLSSPSTEHSKINLSLLSSSGGRVMSLEGNQLLKKVIQHVVNMILWPNVFGQFVFSSFGSIPALTPPTRRNFHEFTYNLSDLNSKSANDSTFSVNTLLLATSAQVFLEGFLNFHQTFKV